MNIDLTNAIRQNSIKAYGSSVSSKGKQSKDATKTGVPKEKVEISDSSASVRKVLDTIKELPDVRIEKVEEIRQRIKNNDYPLENNLLRAVDKMVENKIGMIP